MDRQALGRIVRARRVALGLTQVEAAIRCGISQQMMSFVEGGKKKATLETLQKISVGLGVSLADLTDAEGAIEDPEPDRYRALVERFARIVPKMPDEVLDVFVHQLALWERHYGGKEG